MVFVTPPPPDWGLRQACKLVFAAAGPVLTVIFATFTASAATIQKSNNTTALDQGTSWVGGVAPGAGDLAAFSSLNTASSTPVTIGNGVSFLGIVVTNNLGNNLVINAGTGGTLTLGASGIDMSVMTIWRSLTINSTIAIAADQTWKIGTNSSRTLFENSCEELDFLAAEARTIPGCLGARLTGGGFGGAVLALVRRGTEDDFVKSIGDCVGRAWGRVPQTLVNGAGGA